MKKTISSLLILSSITLSSCGVHYSLGLSKEEWEALPPSKRTELMMKHREMRIHERKAYLEKKRLEEEGKRSDVMLQSQAQAAASSASSSSSPSIVINNSSESNNASTNTTTNSANNNNSNTQNQSNNQSNNNQSSSSSNANNSSNYNTENYNWNSGSTWKAAAGCLKYGKIAMQQVRLNTKKECGYTGSLWKNDLKYHVQECAKNPNQAKVNQKIRNDKLKECKSNNGNHGNNGNNGNHYGQEKNKDKGNSKNK